MMWSIWPEPDQGLYDQKCILHMELKRIKVTCEKGHLRLEKGQKLFHPVGVGI
jgi:hypothetical protein